MPALRIGELARRAGLSVETLRYYERRGLIPPPARLASGYRSYPESTLQRLQFIRRCKQLGFSLDEVAQLLQLDMDPQLSAAEVKAQVDAKISAVKHKIADLQRLQHSLQALSARCCGTGSTSDCPILDFLHQPDD